MFLPALWSMNPGYKLRKIASGGFAFHTPALRSIRSEILDALAFIQTKPRPDSWISTSFSPENQPDLIGPEFFADNLANPVFFHQNISGIPEDSIVVGELGVSCLSMFFQCLLTYLSYPRMFNDMM